MTAMNTTTKLSAALVLLLAAACDNNAEKTPPTTTGSVGPAPVVDQKPVDQPAVQPAAAQPTALSVLDRPASQWTIGGKSLSRVTDEEVLAAAKKAGWTKDDTTVAPLVGGQYEARSFPIEKGKIKGTVKIVRPAATPGTPDSASGFTPPSTLGASMNKETSAFTYDADADVFVGVDLTEGGKEADAKKILDTLVVKSKTPIEGRGIVTTAGGGAGGTDTNAGAGAAGGNAANPGKDSNAVPPTDKGATGTTGNNNAAGNNGSGNTKDSNAILPEANGKANSEPRNPGKDSDSIPPSKK